MFVQKVYTLSSLYLCNYQSMPKRKTSKIASKKHSEVTLKIEVRQSTPEQLQAGNRLFAKLVTRAKERLAAKIGAGGTAGADCPL